MFVTMHEVSTVSMEKQSKNTRVHSNTANRNQRLKDQNVGTKYTLKRINPVSDTRMPNEGFSSNTEGNRLAKT